MTAEIAILNKSGMALAADSKVTIGSGIKAFDTVSKIFPLSRFHPVALMVWGNPDFMEIPIEIICKEYRSQKKTTAEPTIAKWADDFISFLQKFSDHDDTIRKRNASSILNAWFGETKRTAIQVAKWKEVPQTSPEFVSILSEQIQIKTEEIASSDDFVPDAQIESFLDKYWEAIKTEIDDNIAHYGDDELTKRAILFSLSVLLKKVYSPASMGFVVAGYGDKEIFPGFVEFESDGIVGDELKIKKNPLVQVTRSMRAVIQPFAQSEMVHRFMDGADPDYATFADALFRSSIAESCLAVLDEFGAEQHRTDAIRQAIRNAMAKSADEALKVRRQFCWVNFSAPIINMVKMLPKDELPHLAESLVALTSLKRHVSHDAETVGGPIDVALISKGDGLIWIKRKHYFSPELNPQFTAKYLRSIMDGAYEKPTTRRTRRKTAEVGE